MTGEVRVRWERLDRYDAAGFEPLLSSDERERAASFRFARDRSRFVAARGRLRTLLGGRLGRDPKLIEFSYGEHGKPQLAEEDQNLRFNLSHTAGVMALAICEGREVGVDVEAVREDLFAEGIARRYLPAEVAEEIERRVGTERSREFYRGWVRQEAYAKARGGGLALIGESPDPGGWSVIDLDSPDGFAGALAIESGKELVADAARVGYAGGEVGQVVDVLLVRTPKPIR
jgi:4'-phosphopantetheinyl transferase